MSSLDEFMKPVLDREQKEENKKERLKIVYRNVYQPGTLGEEALLQLLYDLHFFDFVQTPTECALHNQGIQMLRDLGIFEPDNYRKIVTALLTIQGTRKVKDE